MLEGSRGTTTGSGKVCAARGMMNWRKVKEGMLMVIKDGFDDTGRGCCRAFASAVAFAVALLLPVVVLVGVLVGLAAHVFAFWIMV